MRFEWDNNKNSANKKKHGLSFEEASELFNLPADNILELYDFDHSENEDRIISIGPINRGVILVVNTERNHGDIIRIISARFATKTECGYYRSHMGE